MARSHKNKKTTNKNNKEAEKERFNKKLANNKASGKTTGAASGKAGNTSSGKPGNPASGKSNGAASGKAGNPASGKSNGAKSGKPNGSTATRKPNNRPAGRSNGSATGKSNSARSGKPNGSAATRKPNNRPAGRSNGSATGNPTGITPRKSNNKPAGTPNTKVNNKPNGVNNADVARTAAKDEKRAEKRAAKQAKKAEKRAARVARRKNRTRKQKILNGLAWLFAAGFCVAVILIVATVISVGKIDTKNVYENVEQSSIVYDINGVEIDKFHYYEDRKLISIDEMPENLKNAFIAIEDKTFYKHHGFNFTRIIGAILSSLTNQSQISGTSTITQQLARNAYLSDIKSQRSIRRKLAEMYIAWRLEQSLTKDEILEAYLNTIYLGYSNYGVDAAARNYFSKEVSDLSLAECAALAALPQAPDTYALISNDKGKRHKKIKDTNVYSNDVSRERRYLVLDLMAEQGFISQDEADSAKKKITKFIKPTFDQHDSEYSYFTDYVAENLTEDLMEEYGLSEEQAERMIYTGGLTINTTLDSQIQDIIVKEFENDYNFPSTVDGSEVQASMVITEVGSGYITAMVGGRNTKGDQLFNRATSPRQPGSSIKPLSVYGAAIQKSADYAKKRQKFPFTDFHIDRQGTNYWGDFITAGSTVVDEPLTINGEQWPNNVTNYFSGWNTFRSALQQSINTCAVKILMQVGTDYSIDMLEKFGITTVVKDKSLSVNDVNPAALALGAMTYGVTPLEMSLAYAAFPNGGVRNSAVCYTQVIDRKGKTILTGQSERTQVMDENVAWVMTDLLKSVVSNGIARNAYIWGVDPGGKTGTTNDRYDVWFDGFTAQYSAALWIGTDLNVEMTSGSWMASNLWGNIMKQIPDIYDGAYREMPDDVVQQSGEYYTSGTEPYRDDYYDYYQNDNGYGNDNGYNNDNGYGNDNGYNNDNGYGNDNGYNNGDNGYGNDNGYNNGDNGYGNDNGYNNGNNNGGNGYGNDNGYNNGGNDYGNNNGYNNDYGG